MNGDSGACSQLLINLNFKPFMIKLSNVNFSEKPFYYINPNGHSTMYIRMYACTQD